MTRYGRAAVPALLLALLPVAPAAARPHGDPVLLALGDSVAAGVRSLPGTPPVGSGYVELTGQLLSQGYNPAANKATGKAATDFDVVNLAVSGATTAELGPQLRQAIDLIADRQADRDPKNDVEVVTLTIGGNDLFEPVSGACVLFAILNCQDAADAALADVRTELTAALARLTAAAGKRVEVVVTTYYNPVGSCVLTLANAAAPTVADVALEGGTLVAGAVPGGRLPDLVLPAGLNDVIRAAAADTGGQVVDLFGELEPTEYVGGPDCLHPNAAGHAAIADEVVATLAR